MDANIGSIFNENWRFIRQQYREIFRAFNVWKSEIHEEEEKFDDPPEELYSGKSFSLLKTETGVPSFSSHFIIELEQILEKIDAKIQEYEPQLLEYLFGRALFCCEVLGIEAELEEDILNEIILIVKQKIGPMIYFPPKSTLVSPRIIIPVQSYLISIIQKNPELIFGITPRQFEELIAEIFLDRGFKVELTQATRDGGRDIIAIYETMAIRTKYLIECKRYAPENKVTVAMVRNLYAVRMDEVANKAILATTSSYTKDAREFASRHIWDLDLKAYDDIIKWVQAYKNGKQYF